MILDDGNLTFFAPLQERQQTLFSHFLKRNSKSLKYFFAIHVMNEVTNPLNHEHYHSRLSIKS